MTIGPVWTCLVLVLWDRQSCQYYFLTINFNCFLISLNVHSLLYILMKILVETIEDIYALANSFPPVYSGYITPTAHWGKFDKMSTEIISKLAYYDNVPSNQQISVHYVVCIPQENLQDLHIINTRTMYIRTMPQMHIKSFIQVLHVVEITGGKFSVFHLYFIQCSSFDGLKKILFQSKFPQKQYWKFFIGFSFFSTCTSNIYKQSPFPSKSASLQCRMWSHYVHVCNKHCQASLNKAVRVT